jgi:valyl-tRNA synthetase
LPPRQSLTIKVHDPRGLVEGWWDEQLEGLAHARPERIDHEPGPGHTRIVAGGVQGFIPLAGVIDLDAERDRLSRAVESVAAECRRSRSKLDNPSFRHRAPADVVAKEEAKAGELEARLHKLEAQLQELDR